MHTSRSCEEYFIWISEKVENSEIMMYNIANLIYSFLT